MKEIKYLIITALFGIVALASLVGFIAMDGKYTRLLEETSLIEEVEDLSVYEVVAITVDNRLNYSYIIYNDDTEEIKIVESRLVLEIGDEVVILRGVLYAVE